MSVDENQAIVYSNYIVSTTVLVVVLALSALFYKRVERLLFKKAFMVGMGIVAMIGSLLVGFRGPSNTIALVLSNSLTAIGTGFLALRIGQLYSTIAPRESLMAAGMSFVVAAALFFYWHRGR